MEDQMNQDPVVVYSTLAVVLTCVLMVMRSVLTYLNKAKAVEKFDHYKPFAIAAAKWVEKQVPDDYGSGAEDPSTAKAVHKLDLFLKKFTETVERFDGAKPNEELKKEAMRWSVELAERMNREKGE